MSDADVPEMRKKLEDMHEKILSSNYVILWSYAGHDLEQDDVPLFEKHYQNIYPFLNVDGKTDDWTDEVWERFNEECSFARAAYTRRDELIYYEGISLSQVHVQRIDGAHRDSLEATDGK